MRHELARLLVRHLVHRLEALHQVAAAELLVRHVDRRMTVHARARLLHDGLPLGERLIVQHVRVAALLAEILRERVSRPHRLQPRILLESRLRDDRSRIDAGRRARTPRCRRTSSAPDPPSACSRRTAAESSFPTPPDPPFRRSARRRGRTDSGPPAGAENVDEQRGRAQRQRRGRTAIKMGVVNRRVLIRYALRRYDSSCTSAAPAAVRVRGIDRERQFLMTLAAGALGDLVIARRDPQRIGVASGCEIERMPEAVLGFRQIFWSQAGYGSRCKGRRLEREGSFPPD